MSFNFGTPNQSLFGTTQQKPAFGSSFSFGQPAAANTSTTFGAPGAFGTATSVAPGAFGAATSVAPGAFGAATSVAPGFGGVAAVAPSFGTPVAGTTPAFGLAPPAAGAPTAFGLQPNVTPAFGIAAQPTMATFGAAASGALPTASVAPNTNFGFGIGQANSSVAKAPAFGTTFGAPTVSVAGATPFGQTSFGAPATSTSFGGAATGSMFGGGLSVAPTSTTFNLGSNAGAPTSFNLFGAAKSTAPSLFGTTTAATTAKPGLFGQPAGTSLFGTPATSTAGGGLFGTATTQSNLFGTPNTGATSLFGGSTFGTGGLGLGTSGQATGLFGTAGTLGQPAGGSMFGLGTFGTQQAQLQMQKPIDTADQRALQVAASLADIRIFNDERDTILKKWNLLQACWGTGKGFYNATQPPIEYNESNRFYVFRGISYFMMPTTDNSFGLVKLNFSKKESELNAQKDMLINGMAGILGNRPNLTVEIRAIKALGDNESEVTVCVSEKSVTGSSRMLPATDLAAYLNQPTHRQQLTNVGVTCITPCIMPSKAQIKEYLKNPPVGFDKQTWMAAQSDNPQPSKFLPMPMNGFSALKRRMMSEEYETGLHRSFLEKVKNEIAELKRKHVAAMAQIEEQKRKFLLLQHRVLQILVKQEVTRKTGLALLPEEEVMRGRLEMLHAHLSLPSQFRGKINELLSTMKLTNFNEAARGEEYKMDPKVQEDVKQFLKMQQNGIAHLVQIINNDLKDLRKISEGMNQIVKT